MSANTDKVVDDTARSIVDACDAVWLTALGFTLVEAEGVIGGKAWRHADLHLSYPTGKALDIGSVVASVLYAREGKVLRKTEATLRDALLPAMGLTIRDVSVYEDGYGKTIASDVVQID